VTYGHFTVAEWEKREGDPFLFENGRWHRITDSHVVLGLDRVNYQAEECDEREPQRWREERTTVAVVSPPEPPSPDPELEARQREYHRLSSSRPALYDWAKTQGYGGRGRISNELRRRYAEKFGLGAVPGQSTNETLLVDDE
jgi:hypothetical protein